jgi:hypothetical protein
MKLRRLAVGCGALAVFAVAGFVPAAASGGRAPETICVGLVIDAHALDAGVSATCVNVKDGTTGTGVLEAAGHKLTFRGDGLLCTIDGMPETGCNRVDNLHFWTYYHRAPDAANWTYATDNMSTYEPDNRETEGWAYSDGTRERPKNIPAAEICDGLVKPVATPTPSPKPTRHGAGHKSPKPSATASMTAAATPTPSVTPTKQRRHPRPRSATPIPPDATSTPNSELNPATTAFGSDADKPDGNGSATGAIIAAGVIAVLAVAAVVGARRRRR